MAPSQMSQVAPYPAELAELVDSLRYRRDRGWAVYLADDLQRDKPGVQDFTLITGADEPPLQLERPYAPNHGPGWDPYLITVERTAIDRRTSFRGELNP
jgi:hypothetical protein